MSSNVQKETDLSFKENTALIEEALNFYKRLGRSSEARDWVLVYHYLHAKHVVKRILDVYEKTSSMVFGFMPNPDEMSIKQTPINMTLRSKSESDSIKLEQIFVKRFRRVMGLLLQDAGFAFYVQINKSESFEFIVIKGV